MVSITVYDTVRAHEGVVSTRSFCHEHLAMPYDRSIYTILHISMQIVYQTRWCMIDGSYSIRVVFRAMAWATHSLKAKQEIEEEREKRGKQVPRRKKRNLKKK